MKKPIRKVVMLLVMTTLIMDLFPSNMYKHYMTVAEERYPKLMDAATGKELVNYERFERTVEIRVVDDAEIESVSITNGNVMENKVYSAEDLGNPPTFVIRRQNVTYDYVIIATDVQGRSSQYQIGINAGEDSTDSTTEEVTTEEPTTEEPTTEEPTTEEPTTEEPTTEEPTTEEPTTEEPTTEEPTTEEPTTEEPTTEEPATSEEVTTEELTTATVVNTEEIPVTTEELTTEEPATEVITTEATTEELVTSEEVTTEELTTATVVNTEEIPVTTEEPTTEEPATEATTTEATTEESVTSEEVTTEELTTATVVNTEEIPVTTEEPTTEEPATEATTEEPVTSEEVTTEELTTATVVNTEEIPVTTEEPTTEEPATEATTTEATTEEPVTSEEVTTEELTTATVVNTEEIPVTTEEPTTEEPATEATTTEATTEEPTTEAATTEEQPFEKLTLTDVKTDFERTKVYDGTTTVMVNQVTCQGILPEDDVTLTAEAFYDNANAGSNKTITVIYTLSGTDADKYEVPQRETYPCGTIEKAQGTVQVQFNSIYFGENLSYTLESKTNDADNAEIYYKLVSDTEYQKTVPVAAGVYEAKIVLKATENYDEVVEYVTFSIERMQPQNDMYEVIGEKNEYGWYISDVTIVGRNGNKVAQGNTSEFADAITVPASDNYSIIIQTPSGAITSAADLGIIYIDKKAPMLEGVEEQKVYDSEELAFTITDENLHSVTVNGEPQEIKDGKVEIILKQELEDMTYEIIAVDQSGKRSQCQFQFVGRVIADSETVYLKANQRYRIAEGKWRVNGEETEYYGGEFYVSSAGEYEFVSE